VAKRNRGGHVFGLDYVFLAKPLEDKPAKK
jgi:hypothetical protein